jgi:3-methyladenine DNA glycosylase AlkD
MPTVVMSAVEVLKELESYGTEQNRKIYKNHGVKDEMYGVSIANIKTLQKKLKIDHDLAKKLWQSGNYDARLLAMLIADPKQATDEQIEAWADNLKDYVTTGYLSGYVAKTAFVSEKMEQWIKSEEEWRGRMGWQLLAYLADNTSDLPDPVFEQYLGVIEQELHTAKNYVRDAMNSAIINIGLRNPNLEQKATETAKRIGKVVVDHGKTGCITPEAIGYIQKTLEYRRKKANK